MVDDLQSSEEQAFVPDEVQRIIHPVSSFDRCMPLLKQSYLAWSGILSLRQNPHNHPMNYLCTVCSCSAVGGARADHEHVSGKNIENVLGGKEYDQKKVPQWINAICEGVVADLTALEKPFKYMSAWWVQNNRLGSLSRYVTAPWSPP